MMTMSHMDEAYRIGCDSYALKHWNNLPTTASRKRQIDALRADQRWQRDHHDEVSRRIDRLIRSIEDGSNHANEVQR